MEQFTELLKKLTKIIRDDNTLTGSSFDIIELAGLSKDQVQQIRTEVKDIELIHIDAFWDLTEQIYKVLMLKTIKPHLLMFFKNKQETTSEMFLEIEYEFLPWHSFLVSVKNQTKKKKFELRTKHSEIQIQTLLDLFQIKDSEWLNDLYDFDYSFNFQSEIESLFREIAFSCWCQAKETTKVKTIGFISEFRGGSYLYNLDTKNNLDEMKVTIPQYLDLYK